MGATLTCGRLKVPDISPVLHILDLEFDCGPPLFGVTVLAVSALFDNGSGK